MVKELTLKELKAENENLRKNLELAHTCFCESENKREQALELLEHYIIKLQEQKRCFNELIIADLSNICEILDD